MTTVETPPELAERLGAPVAALAETVSLAIRIEPQLLRKMRLELFPASHAGLEADLWFSSVVESRAPSCIVLQKRVASALREGLRLHPARLEASWRVIESVHRNVSPALFMEERLAYLALAGRHEEMRELLRSVIATLLSRRGRGLAGWVARAIARLPEEARESEEGQMLAYGASLRLGDGELIDAGIPLAGLTDWAAWLAPDDLETASFGIALLEDAVEFGPVGRPRSHRIDLPKTTPVIVELGWRDAGGDRRKRVALQPQNLTIIETGSGVLDVDIRTVLGNSYSLTAPEPRERTSLRNKLGIVRPPRVQITYDVEVGGAIERKELPFVVGVLAPLSGKPESPLPRLRDRKFVQIHEDNFDQLLAAMNPRLTFEVTNSLGPSGGSLAVDLIFREIADFDPGKVARQVEPLRELMDQRSLIADMGSLLTTREKPKRLEKTLNYFARAWSPQASSGEQTLNLAEVVRELEKAAGVTKDRAELLVRAFVESVDLQSGLQDIDGAVKAYVSRIDKRLSEQMREILHHPDFQALESTWRGLHYLVLQTETSEMLKIRVLNVNKTELSHDFLRTIEFDHSSLFKKVFEEAFGVFGGEPFGLLLGAYEFDQSPGDVDMLENLSRIAAAANAPFIAAAGPEMLRLRSFSLLEHIDRIDKSFDSLEAARWIAFRNSEDSRYVGLTLPRILLRLPYGSETIPAEGFSFEEHVNSPDDSQFLWGSAAFALGSCVTRAFALHGWCAAIRGIEGGGVVEGLPVYTFMNEDGGVDMQCPTQIAISDVREQELSEAGFIPLVYVRGTDRAAFVSANSVQRPRHHESSEAAANAQLAAQLPYIFAVSRFSHYMRCIMRDRIGSFMSRATAQTFLNQWIVQYVVPDDSATTESKAKFPLRDARIEIQEEAKPGVYRAVAFLRPHFQLDGLTVSLRLVVELPVAGRAV